METFIAIVGAFVAGVLVRQFWPRIKPLLVKGEQAAVGEIKKKL